MEVFVKFLGLMLVLAEGRNLPECECEVKYQGVCISADNDVTCDDTKHTMLFEVCNNKNELCCIPNNEYIKERNQADSWYDTCGENKYGEIRTLADLMTTESPVVLKSDTEKRIIGGIEARVGEIPWQVALLHKNEHVCGGALVDEFHVITAAHCVSCLGTGPECALDGIHEVLVGGVNLMIPHNNSRRVYINEAKLHPNYQGSTSHQYDIAILVLSSSLAAEILYNPDIEPICAPQLDAAYNGLDCFMSGWGKTGYPFGPKPDNLHYAQLMSISREDCCTYHCGGSCGSSDCDIYDHNICAHYPGESREACTGDSGGPLVCRNGDKFELVGINSWGIMCGVGDNPSVYISVNYFMDWIDGVINPV